MLMNVMMSKHNEQNIRSFIRYFYYLAGIRIVSTYD
jgi:hypothetical protein